MDQVDEGGLITVRHGRVRSYARVILSIVLGVAVVLAIWAGFAFFFNVSGSASLKFPMPSETFERLGEYLFEGRSLYGHSIWEHIGASIRRLLVAFALASVLGISVGTIVGYFTNITSIGMVPISVFQMIPGLAWLPIAILVFGLGDEAAVFIIFAVSFTVIAAGVVSGIRMVPPVLINAAKMMGANGLSIFFKVLIPQAAASIVSALRVGMSSAWRVLIAAEMVVGTGIGLGYSIGLTRDLLDYVGAFACIAAICLIGLAVDRLVLASIERYIRTRIGMDGD